MNALLTLSILLIVAAIWPIIHLAQELYMTRGLLEEHVRGMLLDAERISLQQQHIAHLETAVTQQQERIDWLVGYSAEQDKLIAALDDCTRLKAFWYTMASLPVADREWALGRRSKIGLN